MVMVMMPNQACKKYPPDMHHTFSYAKRRVLYRMGVPICTARHVVLGHMHV